MSEHALSTVPAVTPSTVSARVAQALSRHVSDVFGVMGNGNAHFLDALAATGTRITAMRHEAGGVAAADAYVRAGGALAAATATYGAGFTNTLTPLAEAVMARIPLVLVVGDAPTTGTRPWDVDQFQIAAGLGAATFTVGRDDATATTLRAIEHAVHRRTAVVLAIPYDLAAVASDEPLRADGTPHHPALVRPSRVEPVARRLDTAAAALRSARRPLILAGRGAWLADAGPVLGELAERLDAYTATTALGLGLFGVSDRDLGVAGGFATERAARTIADADVVLVMGAGLNQFTMRFGEAFSPEAHVIQVDLADAPTNARVDELVRGDAALAAAGLLDRLDGAAGSGWFTAGGAVRPAPHLDRDPGVGVCADGRLDPRSLAHRLNELLPQDRTVVQDGGHFIGWAPSYLDIPSPDRLVMVGTAYQTIGLGFPSAVGAAAVGHPGTTVLCTGDGGGLMALPDLDTVIRTVRSGVVVVFNDAAYGAEVHQYGSRGLDQAPMLIDEVDFAALARALGGQGLTIDTLADLDGLTDWVHAGADGVLLLDCRISTSVVAPYLSEMMHQGPRPIAVD
ncbi:thiamine pyrophosphate-binding protein [Plantibacter sp. Leaf171]|uniref:thiamine pyrophosphate-binding protein n=1 Tax=unclassified Plantibacter TaxID=2624265 RepID=UPI0006F52793|nr:MULTISPECIES: thiamine pyrophosphate-binding protein [unclassified Plantibacter]KQM14073.1 thiamine pyrophosphate-binding protein [Plantibacter sp. Leaf1]KQR57455.1 thiamine pyrophosphate-binding protein [Plantibacter sp. Leaf171]